MTATQPTSEGLGERAATAFTRYRTGDEQQLGELIGLLTPLLWHTARAQGADSVLAEEAIQIAWCRLVDHADTIAAPRAVVSWMVTTVRRETWRLGRGARREVGVEEVPDKVASTPDPESAAILRGQQAVLWRHIGALSERCQTLLRVIAFADRPDYAAIAQSLGMPVGSIGPTRGRCLTKLRAALRADPEWSA